MNVIAIVVSYKNEEMTCHFVNDELSKLKEVTHVVIVNNSASTDSDELLHKGIVGAELIREGQEYSGSKIVVLPTKGNQGFARGNNQGAEFARKYMSPDYLLFTNDDILITDVEVIGKLIEKLDSDDRIGAIGPRIRLKDSDAPQGPIPYSNPWKRYFLPYAIPLPFSWYRKYMEQGYMENAKEGFHYVIIGCFFLMRVSDFFSIGMMDPNTFLYREEECISERLQKQLGKQAYWYPQTDVIHLKSVSTKKNESKGVSVNRIMQESDLYYYHAYHHYPKWIIQLAINSGLSVQKFRFYCSEAAVKIGLKKNIQ